MAWQGGSWGAPGMDRAQFRAWLRTQKKPSFVSFFVVHNTGAPYTLASVGGRTRMKNLENYYKNEKRWRGGPPLFVMGDGLVYAGSPIHLQSVHSPSWNKISIGIEAEGDFDGTHKVDIGEGKKVWDSMAWVFAELLEWFGWPASDKYIRLHREDAATTHACPGFLVTKPWFISKVQGQMGLTAKPPEAPKPIPAVMPIDTAKVKHKVYQPGTFKWSESWCLPMMKRVEGLRLKAYYDAPGWAIGYGHNSTGGIKPIPYDGMVITNAEADAILRADLDDKVRYLNAWVKVPLDQAQIDALAMFIFQQGPTQFKKFLLPTINQKMHWTTANLIEKKIHAKAGVNRRRKLESARYRGESPDKW